MFDLIVNNIFLTLSIPFLSILLVKYSLETIYYFQYIWIIINHYIIL
jgi:hypothetical protein